MKTSNRLRVRLRVRVMGRVKLNCNYINGGVHTSLFQG